MMKRVFVALIAASLVLPAVASAGKRPKEESLHSKLKRTLNHKANKELDHHLNN